MAFDPALQERLADPEVLKAVTVTVYELPLVPLEIVKVLAPVFADIDPALVDAEYEVVLVAEVQLPLAVVVAELDVLTENAPG